MSPPPIELRILSGARAGQSERFEQPVIAIGRHPRSDLRFDATRDLDVSTKHGEIRVADGRYVIVDTASTNGTFVNGQRLAAGVARELHEGDMIAFGIQGPQVTVNLASARLPPTGVRTSQAGQQPAPPTPSRASSGAAAQRPPTAERVAVAVREQTRGLRVGVAAAVIVLSGVAAAGFWIGHRQATARDAEFGRLISAYQDASRQLEVRLQGTNDTALINELKARNDSLVRLARTTQGGQATAAAQQALQDSHDVTRALEQIDLPAMRQANDSAVVLIGSDVGGQRYEATGFSVRRSGLIVTNRHVVSDSTGFAARIDVKFADTPRWRHAHVVKVDDDPTIDLALVQVDQPGPFPVVRGVADRVDVPVGAAIATLGFPLGSDVPMEGAGTDAVAKTSLVAGIVSKSVTDVLQINSFASHGSSGSPVLDAHGHVVGVIYGGMRGSGGRIDYAIPADRIAELIKSVK